jgi:hypothetical protein
MANTNRKKLLSLLEKITAEVRDGSGLWVNPHEHPLPVPEDRVSYLSKTPEKDTQIVNDLYDQVDAAILEGAVPGKRL